MRQALKLGDAVDKPRPHRTSRAVTLLADDDLGHVTETHRGKPTIYSLANFLFDSFSPEDNSTGYLLHMEVTRKRDPHWRTHHRRKR